MLVFMDETNFFSLHLVIDNSHFLLRLVMNNDYLGYIKNIHSFIYSIKKTPIFYKGEMQR